MGTAAIRQEANTGQSVNYVSGTRCKPCDPNTPPVFGAPDRMGLPAVVLSSFRSSVRTCDLCLQRPGVNRASNAKRRPVLSGRCFCLCEYGSWADKLRFAMLRAVHQNDDAGSGGRFATRACNSACPPIETETGVGNGIEAD